MTTAAQRKAHEGWLRELTCLPTAAGREDRVVGWIEAWVAARSDVRLRRDATGNLIVTQRGKGRSSTRPMYITAHLDHPAFVVRRVLDDQTVELEFRGGVHDPYFLHAEVEVHDAHDVLHRGAVKSLDAKAKPFKRVVVELARPTGRELAKGDIGRWHFPRLPRVSKGILHTHACDDLAAVAAALGTLDILRRRSDAGHVGLLFTRAEEIGFVGALAACRDGSVPKRSRLLCLENSRSFPESPIGAGAILRVGDRMTVFEPEVTNRLGDLYLDHAKRRKDFKWQRKLMPGGACEATAFATYGYQSTCLCLPLGNYHNMQDIDGVLAGKHPAQVGPEHIALSDFHGLVEMLVLAATKMDSAKIKPLRTRLDAILKKHERVLAPA